MRACVAQAEYAVRGLIVTRALVHEAELARGVPKPFKQLVCVHAPLRAVARPGACGVRGTRVRLRAWGRGCQVVQHREPAPAGAAGVCACVRALARTLRPACGRPALDRAAAAAGAQPISYMREVFALVNCPSLIERSREFMAPDVIARAEELLRVIPGGTGAYSDSRGVRRCSVRGRACATTPPLPPCARAGTPALRADVAGFIEKRDGCGRRGWGPPRPCLMRAARSSFPANPDHIFITDGASPAVQVPWCACVRVRASGRVPVRVPIVGGLSHASVAAQMLIRAILRGTDDAIMTPMPQVCAGAGGSRAVTPRLLCTRRVSRAVRAAQYPLYSASIALYGGSQVGYYLNEEKGWSINVRRARAAPTHAPTLRLDVDRWRSSSARTESRATAG